MTHTLPPGFRTRPPSLEDADLVVGLFTVCQQAEYGTVEVTRESTLAIWQTPEVDLAKDIWLVFSHDNQLVAYLQLRHEEPLHMNLIMKVHPNYNNLGLQVFLLEYAEELARTFIPALREDARVILQTSCSGSDTTYRPLLEQTGFVHIRTDWRMEIEMNEPPPAPIWPTGITLCPFTLDMAHTVYTADQEAFSDHWGFTPMSFDTFEYWFISTPHFDPTIWFLPFNGEKIAGSAL